jgi:flagellar biosynthesis protein FlhG
MTMHASSSAGEKRVIATGGGKGGVGKSVITANLAVALARRGAEVVVVDADLGAPNLHTFFGLRRIPLTIEDYLAGRCDTLDAVAQETGTPRLRLIPGTVNGGLGAAELSPEAQQRLVAGLATLETSCLLVDVGAGTDLKTLDLFNAADLRLVVFTPEITSIQNGYGFLKTALYRRLQRAVANQPVAAAVAASYDGRAFEIGSTMERVETFLSLLGLNAPAVEEPFRLLLKEYSPAVIGNMILKPSDEKVIRALPATIEKFLGLVAPVLACVRGSTEIRESINRGVPFMRVQGLDHNYQEMDRVATWALAQDVAALRRLRGRIMEGLQEGSTAFEFGFDSVEIDVGEPHAAGEAAAA